jgi:hypothetical protein
VVCQTWDAGLAILAQRFERFAQRECHVSLLYERLARGIAHDPEILSIAAHAREGQPVANLLLATVHYLLLRGAQHPLTAFYASLSHFVPASDDPYPSFRGFCLEHAEDIRRLIATRLVQTNEVRRCGCLLPAFGLVARRAGGRPLAVVEIGASAGLNLLWDHYGYDYGEHGRYGARAAAVQIACTVRGTEHPPLPVVVPTVATRLGLDLHPINVRDPDATLWLRALVWPDEAGRADLLRHALQVASQHPPTLLGGDALERLAAVLAGVPADQTLCVFHTHTLNQFSQEGRAQLASLLAQQACTRDLYQISIEWLGREYPCLELVSFVNGTRSRELLAYCGSHGEWLEWLSVAESPAP